MRGCMSEARRSGTVRLPAWFEMFRGGGPESRGRSTGCAPATSATLKDSSDLPHGPIFEYLARTVSAMYVIHGLLCLLLATDVRRFGPIITFVASIELCFAALVLWIDRRAQMPVAWTLIEAPLIVLFSGTTLALRCRAARARPD